MESTSRLALGGLEEKVKSLEAVQRAALNILEDFGTEKKRLEDVQTATLNILEDFNEEKRRLEDVQTATLNILEDFNEEKRRLEQVQKAMLNILEDVDVEKTRVAVANQHLEAANKELEAFTYSVSHDLRAPLRHIDGFSRILLEELGPQVDANAKHYLNRIREGTLQMALMIEDFLKLARVGRQEFAWQVAGLSSVVNEALREVHPEMEGRQVQLRIEPLPFVECDPAMMKLVFVNLLSNALKFTRTRAEALIEVGTLIQDAAPIFFVRDNGVGFSMKYADKLFGVFQRLHRSEDFPGTGVGLATVHRIIQKHGGRIWAEAELNMGATFCFTLGASERRD